jgi:hypothetical protein
MVRMASAFQAPQVFELLPERVVIAIFEVLHVA